MKKPPKAGEKWVRNTFENRGLGPQIHVGAVVEITFAKGDRVRFSHRGRAEQRMCLAYFLERYEPDDKVSVLGPGDCAAALLAVLRAHRGLPALAKDVGTLAGKVLAKAGRPWTSADWGEAVRALRGNGIMVESHFEGERNWKLGKDDPEYVTAGWPDEGAEAAVKEMCQP